MSQLRITSRGNPKVKALLKEKDRYCFFEGEKLVRDILRRSIPISILMVDEKVEGEWVFPTNDCVTELWIVSSDVLAKFSNLTDKPRVIAVTPWVPSPVDFSTARVVIGLDQIQDPGNAGTVFRCAAAFGVDGVVFSGASVHFTNNKFLRAAQNTLFEVCHQHFSSVNNLIQEAQHAHMNIYLTSSHASTHSLLPAQIKPPCLILLGNEGQGLDEELFKQYPSVIIPQTGKVESLNVGICACLIMYEVSSAIKK